jgi:DNA polymerase-3 subunit gamma/tau
MSFQALARIWRPRRFDQVVGQEHIVRALTHALDAGKLHHALLFSGTRGVGKTTLARIIAKCLNCECGVSASPCLGADACPTCREIDEGRYVDLIEVDAASRTGVDDTRELMDNVQYAPTRGRTKVYLIDEVHMLSRNSFNALLKTLEEPPPRVQFLLATTEPEKIPVTILSRCLQFPLKRLPAPRIAERLQHVTATEALTAEDEALTELARAADGSMRDGLSLLDQAVAFSGGPIAVGAVRSMLGTIGTARVAELVDAVIAARAGEALAALAALYAQGIDMRYLLDALATAWMHIATIQALGEPADDEGVRWQEQAARLDPRLTQLLYDITLAGVRDLPHAPEPLVGVQMTVLRMLTFAPETAAEGDPGVQPVPRNHAVSAPPELRQAALASTGVAEPAGRPGLDSAAAPSEQPPEPTEDSVGRPDGRPQSMASDPANGATPPQDWHALVSRLNLQGFAAQLANHAICRHLDDRRIELEIARSNAFLATDDAKARLQQALARLWQASEAPQVSIQIVDQLADTPAKRSEDEVEKRQQQAVASIENDPIIQKLRSQLGARLRPETVKPHRSPGAMQQGNEQ